MTKKVYAVAETVPAYVGYLTAGKEYLVLEESHRGFKICDDFDNLRLCLPSSCSHLGGGNWNRIERDDAEPVPAIPTVPDMTLRDWFASRAPEPPATWWGGGAKDCAGYALWGFQYADAMLTERERQS